MGLAGPAIPKNGVGSGEREGEGREGGKRGGREEGTEVFRTFGAAVFLNVRSNTASFSLRVKAKVPTRSYTVWSPN